MDFSTQCEHKHPLERSWTFWYMEIHPQRSWQECLKEIATFKTVEDFWSLFGRIKPVGLLRPRCDYYLFNNGIPPMWEDEANRNGGRWIMNIGKNCPNKKLDFYWLQLAMNIIGECFHDFNEDINGAAISIRENCTKISLWIKYSQYDANVIPIGMKLKEVLRCTRYEMISYQSYREFLDGTSTTKFKYRI